MDIREKINNAAMELKIAVFCAVILGLSYVYKIIDPNMGDMICKVSVLTFITSILIFFYKIVFGKSLGLFATVIFACIYITGIGVIIREGLIIQIGIITVLLFCAIKSFIWIFIKKKSNTEDETNEADTKNHDGN
ncbi:MAG: hypothetical protein IKO94_07765 [Selenomonadaceae bacterium]|nr:hypothetical protein [Selenomonadaceae bacterium]